jgi:ATP-dependent protease ClpP protease subunit
MMTGAAATSGLTSILVQPTMRKPSEPKSWYRVENAAGTVADLYIMDEIGAWGVTASDLVRELAGISARSLTLHLSSPGGDVFDAVAIYNALRNHPAEITVNVIGLAASAASFIAQAGDVVTIERNAQMMVHDASGGCFGQAGDMRSLADLLDKVSANIADIYAQRSGRSAGAWREAMLAETWYSAAEAVAVGLADSVRGEDVADEKVAASYDLSRFRFQGRHNAPPPCVDMTQPAARITPVEEIVALDGAALVTALKEALA